jgi:heme/copper-type cytochrome/quinol oxidase subunit 1
MGTAARPRRPPRLDRKEGFEHAWSQPSGFPGILRVVDNIPIAQLYLATGFGFFILGGILALLMWIQLGTPDNTFLDAETYNQIFTMHGTTMMFLFVIPFIEALANYLLPLMLGTRDLPFPRLTATPCPSISALASAPSFLPSSSMIFFALSSKLSSIACWRVARMSARPMP